MIARRVSTLALLIAVVVAVVLVLDSGSNPYVIKMRLADADGLRQGSPVAVGGQDVGTISMKVQAGEVVVSMNLDHSQAPVGRDASASVASVNLLGQKRVELAKGDISSPAPSGYMLPAAQVNVTTDLDQVIDVLTPDVRSRLAILINAAGQAFTGRKADFSQMLAQLPPDLNAGTALVNGISSDNHTLGALVAHTDSFVSQLASQRAQLIRTVKVFGDASATVQAKRAQLAATLQRAPGALATLQTFLVKLRSTTVPLGPAAVDITNTAPALDQTLAQLEPFRRVADPTLREATQVAPELTRLATGATPVIGRATPVVASLASFGSSLQPVSDALNGSIDNLVGILQNWSRAIQFRDGLSHVFRGEATMTPQILESMLNQLQAVGALPSLHRAAATVSALQHSAASAGRSSASSSGAPSAPAAQGSSSGSTPAGSSELTPGASPPSGAAPAQPGGSSGSAGGSSAGGPLGSLLSYLLKP
jgi:phospholipid/cholesterol/gamma-HCH transport system substrate-binding protein